METPGGAGKTHMVVTWWKAALFLLGGIGAAGGTAYVTGLLDPWLGSRAPMVASLPEGVEQPPQADDRPPAAPEPEAADTPEDEEPAPAPEPEAADTQEDEESTPEQEPEATDAPAEEEPAVAAEEEPAAEQPTLPTFDLVRIEPDGSLVVAGNAAPGSRIEILTGGETIATTEAGEHGDFVAVLDEPLDPGDYEIVLRATAEGEEPVVSEQTALVSVPEQEDGQVLAMVDEPGEPSRILTAPEPEMPTDDEAGDEAETDGQQDQGSEAPETAVADQETAPAGDEQATAAEPEAVADEETGTDEAGDEQIAAVPSDDLAESEQQAAPPEDAAAGEQLAAPVENSAEDEQPAVSTDADAAATPADDAPQAELSAEVEDPDPAAQDKDPGPADEEENAVAEAPPSEDEPAETEIAAAPPADDSAEAATSSEPDAATPFVVVEAVEIEGDMIYVAGSATPGRTVRIYADALLIGDALASPGGRFLVEARRELPVGDYIIRADLLAADGSVLARAAVPFEREPGESIAAVAPSVPAVDEPVTPEQMADATDEAQDGAGEAATAPATEQDGAATDIAAEDTAPAEGALPEQAADGTDVPATPEPQPVQPGASQDGTEVAPGADAPSAEAPETIAAAEPEAPSLEVPEQTAAAETGDRLGSADSSAPKSNRVGGESAAAEITQPKLERAEGSVIIRRGDTLWRISRRVYGHGIRYSTIYLANQDQIRDPDLIWPGQIFSVPGETAEGEEADLDAISDQLVREGETPDETARQ